MKKLLVETHRPSTIDGYNFPNEELKKQVTKWIKRGEIPNILLTGSPGTGKTTLSRILINELEIGSTDVLSLNASLLKMEQIRELVEPFLGKTSFSKFKIVQLEEADRLSLAAMQSLRQLIEDSSDRVRWIATANYPDKIIPALHSRFQHFIIDSMVYDDVVDHIVDILDAEEIIVNVDNDLLSHIDAFFPDIRKILNSIDQSTDEDKVLHAAVKIKASGSVDEFTALLKDNGTLEELLFLSSGVDMNNYEEYYQALYENISVFQDKPFSVIKIAKYLDMATRSANQRLNLDACLYELFTRDAD
jgi:DNA polymerase III delta prime subunit